MQQWEVPGLDGSAHIVHYLFLSTAPKRRYVPVSHDQHSDGSSASVYLVHGRLLILVLPGNPGWFSIRFCCWLMAVFELALVSINLCKEAKLHLTLLIALKVFAEDNTVCTPRKSKNQTNAKSSTSNTMLLFLLRFILSRHRSMPESFRDWYKAHPSD